jgi:hypothetical protein
VKYPRQFPLKTQLKLTLKRGKLDFLMRGLICSCFVLDLPFPAHIYANSTEKRGDVLAVFGVLAMPLLHLNKTPG